MLFRQTEDHDEKRLKRTSRQLGSVGTSAVSPVAEEEVELEIHALGNIDSDTEGGLEREIRERTVRIFFILLRSVNFAHLC